MNALVAGGTAADAAVAAAAVLTVVDPRSTGIGGDLFALYWQPGQREPIGLAAAGVAPAGMTVDAVRAAGYSSMPLDGPWSVTVPGAAYGWSRLLERFGALDRSLVVADAIRHAESGFAVSPVVAAEWATATDKLSRNPEASKTYLPGGRPPQEGQQFLNPALATTITRFALEGHDPFYRGDLAAAMAAAVQELGGPLRFDDLSAWEGPEWVSPISAQFRGTDVFELPPPGQGLVVLEGLRIYDGFDPVTEIEQEHFTIEALKLAFADASALIADPRFEDVPVGPMLSDAHVESLRRRIGYSAAAAVAPGSPSDTVYVAAVDSAGGACSLIQSHYESFGSGIGVPGTGLVMHNRGSGFTLEDDHPNRPVGGKRPYHTIIPAMLGRDGSFVGSLGVVGGYMQPQGQLQILRNLFDRSMSPQEAVDAPRLRVYEGLRVGLEPGFDAEVASALADRGHLVTDLPRFERGGAQLIVRSADGELVGATDSRKDGIVGSR